MKNKFAWIAIPLVAGLCAVAYVFFASGPPGPAMSAESELAVPATSETLADGQPVAAEQEQKSDTRSAPAPDARPLKRESDTKGDGTDFTLNHGDIGYVDVRSVMQDRDPYSIVALLQAHEDLTGAGDSLEITIENISENDIWGQEVRYRQVIEGEPVRQGGKVFFSSDGAVTRLWGNLINTQSLSAGDILILPPEAEAIALDAAARYAENLKSGRPEWSDLPVTLTAHPAESFYDLDSDSKLVRLWIVEVRIRGPRPDYVRVAMSPETGEVVRMDSLRVDQTYADQIFVVCDAGKAMGADGQPSTNGIE